MRKARVNVAVPAEDYPLLRALAQAVKRPAGAVVLELVRLYGTDYEDRRRRATAAAADAERRALAFFEATQGER